VRLEGFEPPTRGLGNRCDEGLELHGADSYADFSPSRPNDTTAIAVINCQIGCHDRERSIPYLAANFSACSSVPLHLYFAICSTYAADAESDISHSLDAH
jgi:hypothetical protein